MPETKVTTDHHTIKEWVSKRGGVPASVKGTEWEGEPVGILRIHFPQDGGDVNLKEITWEEFFWKFDEQLLAFLYQTKTKSGKLSRFCKLVGRTTR